MDTHNSKLYIDSSAGIVCGSSQRNDVDPPMGGGFHSLYGNLPLPVEKMLESKHGIYDNVECDLKLAEDYDVEDVLSKIS